MGGTRSEGGKKGIAAQYIGRNQAVKDLQVTLKDFRRLCILKGIYPRDPKRKPGNNNHQTYYHKKDIAYLRHEPLLHKFRSFKTFLKKYKKACFRGEKTKARQLKDTCPKMTFDHLVRERYPTFGDALGDLDDAVSMINLYARLKNDVGGKCLTLSREFNNYLIQSRSATTKGASLDKVFATIKGYYFEANLQGSIVRWIVPHQFTQEIPDTVDQRVMNTFLDFYQTLVSFVNFKLYHDLGLVYPPVINVSSDEQGLGIQSILKNYEFETNQEKEQDIRQDAIEFSKLDKDSELSKTAFNVVEDRLVFRSFNFLLNRETPQEILELCILCLGGSVIFQGRDENEANITHHVIDRPLSEDQKVPGREYIQPQWVLDCLNERAVLPTSPYAPGQVLPPHLSPFVDDEKEGYVPEQRQVLDNWVKGRSVNPVNTPSVQYPPLLDPETEYNNELSREFKGESYSEQVQTSSAVSTNEKTDIDKDLAKSMMSNKHKRLYSKMQHGIQEKRKINDNLREKRARLDNDNDDTL